MWILLRCWFEQTIKKKETFLKQSGKTEPSDCLLNDNFKTSLGLNPSGKMRKLSHRMLTVAVKKSSIVKEGWETVGLT